ncbi:hypothetical protein A1342_00250 [Methylomonas methanica]|nr:hypothetical protein A1342_00250 [Methylomonas methanica]
MPSGYTNLHCPLGFEACPQRKKPCDDGETPPDQAQMRCYQGVLPIWRVKSRCPQGSWVNSQGFVGLS